MPRRTRSTANPRMWRPRDPGVCLWFLTRLVGMRDSRDSVVQRSGLDSGICAGTGCNLTAGVQLWPHGRTDRPAREEQQLDGLPALSPKPVCTYQFFAVKWLAWLVLGARCYSASAQPVRVWSPEEEEPLLPSI